MAIGERMSRLEDPPLLRGEGRFAADIVVAGCLHMRVVRSRVAHGRLRGADTVRALELEGVVATFTASDFPDLRIGPRGAIPAEAEPYLQPVLAHDHVRYVGEPVAIVIAQSAALAEDGADMVRLDIEELPVVSGSAGPASPWPLAGLEMSNEPSIIRKSYGNVENAFREAHAVVEVDVEIGRQTGAPMETRGAVADYDPASGSLTLFGAAKVPHANREALSRLLDLPLGSIRLVEGHTGGGFGIRGELYPEDVLVCLASMRLGRPVKWIEDRREHFHASNHARDQRHQLRAAVREDGFIVGIEADFTTDQGAYLRTSGTKVTDISAGLLPGPYLVPSYRVTARVRLTNKTPAGTMRSPGRYETTFARERLVDAVAERLGLDPADVRKVNFISPEAMPFARGIDAGGRDVIYDSGDYAGLLRHVLDHVSCADLRGEVERRKADGEMVGIGIGAFIEKSGINGEDRVVLEVGEDGIIDIVTGSASMGQGMETVLAQICAEELRLPIASFRVVHGQTERIEEGHGAYASLVTVLTGSAVKRGAEALVEIIRGAAARLFQASPDEVVYDAGVAFVPGGPSMSLAELVRAIEPGAVLRAEGIYQSEGLSYPYGIHLAVVRVEPDSCAPVVERLVIGYDVGRAINPALVEAQLVGAAAQGIGGVLFEELVFDARGMPLRTGLTGYAIPKVADIPPIELVVREDAPSPVNPLGAKGAGEGGITGVGAAVAAAVDDAIGRPGAIRRLPIRASDVHAALYGSGGGLAAGPAATKSGN